MGADSDSRKLSHRFLQYLMDPQKMTYKHIPHVPYDSLDMEPEGHALPITGTYLPVFNPIHTGMHYVRSTNMKLII